MQGRVFVGSQNLGRRDAHAVQAAGRELGATHRGLAGRGLRDRLHLARRVLAGHDLVHHGGGRRARTGHQAGTHAVGVHGGGGQRGDGVFVQVAGHGDLRVGVTQRIEQFAHVGGGGDQVTRVQANAAELLAGQFHAQAHGVVHVVGVDQQGRAGAEGTQLRLEGFALVVV